MLRGSSGASSWKGVATVGDLPPPAWMEKRQSRRLMELAAVDSLSVLNNSLEVFFFIAGVEE